MITEPDYSNIGKVNGAYMKTRSGEIKYYGEERVMITDEMIDAGASALENISFTGKVSPINGHLEINLDSELCAKASLEAAYPLIRQQVLKEVSDALLKSLDSTDISYVAAGVAKCRRIVENMMEGGE